MSDVSCLGINLVQRLYRMLLSKQNAVAHLLLVIYILARLSLDRKLETGYCLLNVALSDLSSHLIFPCCNFGLI